MEDRIHERRRRRMLIGFTVSLFIAGGAGVYYGIRSQPTLDEIRAEQPNVIDGAQGDLDMSGISSEVNRTLLELWRMEEVEYQRNSR